MLFYLSNLLKEINNIVLVFNTLFILDINNLIKLSINLCKEININYAFYRYYYITTKVRFILNSLNKDYYFNLSYNISLINYIYLIKSAPNI